MPVCCELILGGGFSGETSVWSSRRQSIATLQSTYEEADTRLLLHAKDAECSGFGRTVIKARDTDVLVIALGHRGQCSKDVWMSAGKIKYLKVILVHAINLPVPLTDNLMAYHAITGCYTTSQFSNKGKKTTWKVFQEKHELLNEIEGSAQCCKEALSNHNSLCVIYMGTTICIPSMRCGLNCL